MLYPIRERPFKIKGGGMILNLIFLNIEVEQMTQKYPLIYLVFNFENNNLNGSVE